MSTTQPPAVPEYPEGLFAEARGAREVVEVLEALDRQYQAERQPPVYFRQPEEPITPRLDALLGPSKVDVPLEEPIAPHLDELLGPVPPTREPPPLTASHRPSRRPQRPPTAGPTRGCLPPVVVSQNAGLLDWSLTRPTLRV